MNTFDEREKAFEAKFKQDEDIKFKLKAKRNKFLGEWAGETLQKENIEEYIKEVRESDLKKPGDENIIEKIMKDFSSSNQEITREELYDSIGKNARLNRTYLLLIFLSTVVVAIGLLKDNVAVVIGAMVIAPLLGPNLAMALGTALGDTDLMWKAFKTGIAGMSLALVLSILIGIFWPLNVESRELLARTHVGLDSAALAMASGAAAVLSLTSGIPSILVGVMVAVALLPPAATLGLMLGAGQIDLAYGAAFLLAVNIVAVNLSAKLGFLIQGIKPRTWLEKKKAKQSMMSYIIMWVLTLIVLLVVIYFHPDF